ncbi:MFS transporter [Gracilibacillus massiliensis]|uniref:MFS transporter n=1 Tax=Gracilibacillus massiliensis TaxID=1564956 RepID=UPI00071CECED|nr:MFS transporter [Gracilibacillus massiliensis]
MIQQIKQKPEKRLSAHAVNILINHAIFQFGSSLSIIFVNLYLWRLTNSLWVNGLYNLIAILIQAVTTFSIGKMSKKKGRTTIYRYGIMMTALFYLLIVMVQEEIVTYFYLFALLRGIAQGLYWVAYFTIVHEVSSNENRHRYLGWNQMVMGSTNLIAPALAGFMIGLFNGLAGYLLVFSIAFLMFFVATLRSFRIKKESIRHRNYYMKYLGQIVERNKAFRNALFGWFIIGFPQGILMYIPAILIYSIFENESIVGYLNALFLAVSILASFIISRFANIQQTKKYLWIAATGFFASGLFLTWEIAIVTVILFMVTQNIFKPLQANAYAAYYFEWLDRIPLGNEFRVESVVLRETIINIGRGLGIIVFMIFSNEIDTNTVVYVIVLAMSIQFILPVITKLKEE